jgi:DNA repair exonuclease SbcCD nuclease subunit
MAIRFVHTADLHLGSPFVGLEKAEPRIARAMRESTFRVFDAIIELCVAEDVDTLLIAGDVIDGAIRSPEAQKGFQKGLTHLHEAGIPSFVCHGNHDPLDEWDAGVEFPESCRRFGSEVEEVPISLQHPEKGVVLGVSYPTSQVVENLAVKFRPSDSSVFSVGLLHCNVADDPNHASFAPCSVSDLTGTGIDYWALGHIHNRRVIRESSPVIVYPGTPQGRHPGEPGSRGVTLVSVDDDNKVEMESRPVDIVRWGRVKLDATSIVSARGLIDTIVAAVEKELAEAEGRSLLYTVTLSGSTPLNKTLQRSAFVEGLIERVNEHLWREEPWAWCSRIGVKPGLPVI